jgi:diguanylate cyclase (GGDEF)-like protein
MQLDEDLMRIPVIVITIDQNAELDCLRIGAMDFLPKPYPDIDIIKARVAKCIELSEGRELIRHTENDKLTGLFNKEYFYRYVSRLDQIYKDAALDAFVCDVNGFHSINKEYGRRYGDHVLRSIGAGIKKMARKTGGIGCRQSGDTFLIYCQHQDDYEQLLLEFLKDVIDEKDMSERISMRFGVYTNAEEEPDIEERFDRAKIAADRIKDEPDRLCGFYDLA